MSKEFEEKVLGKLEQLDALSKEQKTIMEKLEKLDVLAEEFNEFRKEQREFNAKQEQFNAKQEQFNAKQEQFNAKQEKLNEKIIQRLNTIERNIVIIEDKVSNEIPALFDADKTREEKQNQFEVTLHNLDEKAEDHSIRILALEYTSEKHDEQIKNLVS